MADRTLDTRQLADATKGVLFLGTPFAFTKRCALQYMHLLDSEGDSIADLPERSEIVDDITTGFRNYFWNREGLYTEKHLKLACFFESNPTWVENQDIGVVVERSFATISGVHPQPIAASHLDMCKFASTEDQGLQRVSGKLSEWIVALEPQFPDHSDHSQGSSAPQLCNRLLTKSTGTRKSSWGHSVQGRSQDDVAFCAKFHSERIWHPTLGPSFVRSFF